MSAWLYWFVCDVSAWPPLIQVLTALCSSDSPGSSCRWRSGRPSHTPRTPRSSTSGICTCTSLSSSPAWWCSPGCSREGRNHRYPLKSVKSKTVSRNSDIDLNLPGRTLCPWFRDCLSWRRTRSSRARSQGRPGPCPDGFEIWDIWAATFADHSSSFAWLHVLHQTSLSA